MTSHDTTAATAADVAPGTVLGERFGLAERVACGPFAEVWRASDVETGKPFAVKIARNPTGVRMLHEEVAVFRRLDDFARHIVPVLHQGRDPVHIVMPWLSEGTLRDAMRAGAGGDERARLLKKLLVVVDTVATVHARGIVHGDLKPENVLVDPTRGALLTDFGLARERQTLRREQSLRQSLDTTDGLAGGTLAYLPPEAVKGAEPSARGDVYALGVMLHEVLIGRRPDKATSPEALRAQLPDAIVDVLCRALAFDPEDRFADAGELDRALGPLRDELLATGLNRHLRTARRLLLAALAAFFVTFRYAAVLAVLGVYAGCVVACLPGVASVRSVFVALGLVPTMLIFQVLIRWEGPETGEEASARRERNQRRVLAASRPAWVDSMDRRRTKRPQR